ncbi:hypothetical protein H0I76_04995 [Limibaculum sp. M0105]|uniref:Uncharacterized protein n=1 Tax=Thermohalobaculum xanthum TaxID=2753746 RepID=A0A8J7M6C4_9RHOB|nr:hypothetical protein [Thermohalobaculum xanthum]MBK0398535.1 hypothetical protein [Thermohalobaculum xanthum]
MKLKIAERGSHLPTAPSLVLGPYLDGHRTRRRYARLPIFGFLDLARKVGSMRDFGAAKAFAAAQSLPDDNELAEIRERMRSAADRPTRANEAAQIVAAMLDAVRGFDAAKSATFVEFFVFSLELELAAGPVSLHAIAEAALHFGMECTWPPTPREFIAKARKFENRYRSAVRVLDWTMAERQRLIAIEAHDQQRLFSRTVARRPATQSLLP